MNTHHLAGKTSEAEVNSQNSSEEMQRLDNTSIKLRVLGGLAAIASVGCLIASRQRSQTTLWTAAILMTVYLLLQLGAL